MTTGELVRLAVGVVLLVGVVLGVLRVAGVRTGWAPVVAIGRGAVQLAVVGLALRGVLAYLSTSAAVLLIMVGTATWTATGRLRGPHRPGRAVVMSCVTGAAVSLGVVFTVGVWPFSARYVVAVGGVVIGGRRPARRGPGAICSPGCGRVARRSRRGLRWG